MRLALIILSTLVGAGALWLVHEMPIRADMKKWAQVLPLAAGLFVLFFSAVQLIEHHAWWLTPALVFAAVAVYGFKQLARINRHIDANKPSAWLTAVMASAPVIGAPMDREPTPRPAQAAPTSEPGATEAVSDESRQVPLDDLHGADEPDLVAELDAMRRLVSTQNYALRLLVNLKDGPRDADYERDKPLAWDLARAAVAEVDALRTLRGGRP
jgi:hypothetical protein